MAEQPCARPRQDREQQAQADPAQLAGRATALRPIGSLLPYTATISAMDNVMPAANPPPGQSCPLMHR